MSGSAKCLKFRQFGTLLKCVNLQNMTSQGRRNWGGQIFKIFGATYYLIWQYGLSSFQLGDTKLERFLPKNQYTQTKIIEF